jgi:hypothetical protein
VNRRDPDAPLRTKVDYDARARARASCEVCGAPPSKPCMGPNGVYVRYTHVARRRTARGLSA